MERNMLLAGFLEEFWVLLFLHCHRSAQPIPWKSWAWGQNRTTYFKGLVEVQHDVRTELYANQDPLRTEPSMVNPKSWFFGFLHGKMNSHDYPSGKWIGETLLPGADEGRTKRKAVF